MKFVILSVFFPKDSVRTSIILWFGLQSRSGVHHRVKCPHTKNSLVASVSRLVR